MRSPRERAIGTEIGANDFFTKRNNRSRFPLHARLERNRALRALERDIRARRRNGARELLRNARLLLLRLISVGFNEILARGASRSRIVMRKQPLTLERLNRLFRSVHTFSYRLDRKSVYLYE